MPVVSSLLLVNGMECAWNLLAAAGRWPDNVDRGAEVQRIATGGAAGLAGTAKLRAVVWAFHPEESERIVVLRYCEPRGHTSARPYVLRTGSLYVLHE